MSSEMKNIVFRKRLTAEALLSCVFPQQYVRFRSTENLPHCGQLLRSLRELLKPCSSSFQQGSAKSAALHLRHPGQFKSGIAYPQIRALSGSAVVNLA